jgi:ATP-dependent DNA helicase RecG
MASLSKLAKIPVSEVKMLGNVRSRILAGAGIETIADLIHHVPYKYIDRSTQAPIARVPIGEEVTIIGEIGKVNTRRPKPMLMIIEATIGDGSANLKLIWFNQKYRAEQVKPGIQVAVSGIVESFRGTLQMKSPQLDLLDDPKEALTTGRVVPIHERVGDVRAGHFRRAIHNALNRSHPIDDPVPALLREKNELMGRDAAFTSIHFPESIAQVGPARRRLVYDELFRLELALAIRKRHQILDARGIEHRPTGELTGRFLRGLPYELTAAQLRVIGEIADDLTEPHPMHRLLQGEVGSGKTVVAVHTLLSAVEGGWQGAIMAPTEVLAEQHYLGVGDLLAQAGLSPDPFAAVTHLGMESLFGGEGPAVHLALLTGSRSASNYAPAITRAELLTDIANGQVDIVVGTHALIQEGVDFSRLGAAVVDEQHRFGVAQRVDLKAKAVEVEPDLLIMTATPIPRTLSMTLYGDLDVSEIDEMPPGRVPAVTRVLPPSSESRAWDLVRKEVANGRQAFVVCPLVEDSPKIEASSAVAEHERLAGLFAGLTVGLIHGQMRSADKEAAMAAFRDGETDVLVSTTVIEVGIDVPNATVMVIEDADRFGLSQLHQLRGRVGRGRYPGTCLLIGDPGTTEGQQRLDAMAATTDGFRLAEEDLRIRGQGTVFGTRQSGAKDLRLANIIKDIDVLIAARKDAFALVDSDPDLSGHPDLAEELAALLGDSADWLFIS